jgi:hypothetical protein
MLSVAKPDFSRRSLDRAELEIKEKQTDEPMKPNYKSIAGANSTEAHKNDLGTFFRFVTLISETKPLLARKALIATSGFLSLCLATNAFANGLQAELRSSTALLPVLPVGVSTPTAPAGGIVVGGLPWLSDAAQGFTPLVAVENGVSDPLLAVSTSGLRLPISPTAVPATCGQVAYDGKGNAYITQGVVDTKVTPSSARGILRVTLNPQTGTMVGPATYIAVTAGLDGDQPTGAALGPDGNLYVAFLKNGNIKRVINPGVGTTQVVQSVGTTPGGHPGRSLAFLGNDLYIGSLDALSIIHNATAAFCTGGCNATPITDGFPGVPHVALTSDGSSAIYFAVSGYNQVWRYTPSTALFAFVSQGGFDRNGSNASSFSFVPAKCNLMTLDASGNMWLGDDTSNAAAVGAGRLWTISSLALSGISGGTFTAGTELQAILNTLRGPWEGLVASTIFTPTFNADGTFTATIQSPSGVITTDSGTWTLTPPINLSPFGNPQGHLSLVDSQGNVLLSGDVLLINPDQFVMFSGSTTIEPISPIGTIVLSKMTI